MSAVHVPLTTVTILPITGEDCGKSERLDMIDDGKDHRHTHIHMHACTHAHTQAHVHTHTHTHTHTHVRICTQCTNIRRNAACHYHMVLHGKIHT